MEVFETFKEQKRPLSLSEIADEINTPISTCHEIVRTLRDRGYLYLVNGRSFYPTGRIVACARAIAANDPIVHRLAPALEQLRDATGETVILGKLQRDHVVYLAIEEGRQTIRYGASIGDSKPLHSSAIGKATVAQLDEKARAVLLSKLVGAFLSFSPSGRDQSEGAVGGNSFFPQPAKNQGGLQPRGAGELAR